MRIVRLRVCVAAIGMLAAQLVVSQLAWAQMPMEKHGSCPSGYHQSGNYCTPSSGSSLPALQKIGSCPSGYHQSGDYCLASSNSSKPAMPKSGSCPSGYHQSGDYCLKS
jgi:hypothetical protein